MSIEKIKERIRMIEENDFNILKEGEYRANYGTDDPEALINHDKSKNLYKRLTEPKAIQKIGSAGSYANSASDTLNQALSGSNRATIGVNNWGAQNANQLPDHFEDIVFFIYDQMRINDILPTDIDNSNKAVYGYTPDKPRLATAQSILRLNRLNKVIIYFNDEISKATKIIKMVIDVQGKDPQDIRFFVNEIEQRGYQYNVTNIKSKPKNSQYPTTIEIIFN